MTVCGILNVMTLVILAYWQSESSDPRDFYCDEWMDWCDFNPPDRYYGFSPEDGEAQLPVSKCTHVRAVEEATTPG